MKQQKKIESNYRSLTLLLFSLFCFFNLLHAQEIEIKGSVIDEVVAFRRERHTSHHVAGCHLLTLFLSDPQPEQFDLLPSTESGRGLHPLFISSPPIPTVTLNTNSGLPIEHIFVLRGFLFVFLSFAFSKMCVSLRCAFL